MSKLPHDQEEAFSVMSKMVSVLASLKLIETTSSLYMVNWLRNKRKESYIARRRDE